nr:PREDICTED: uncharacterized protein LOC102361540 isoform X2 [Latimeria chalumnae]XP_014347954.1 PREDICTED: uncharacterized protein LOC102361540 isoform X2 [Latimeria chalumnae]|eukprot:XP_014347953.1 PREDICTED: uncharacterized protein LOC102361540 isoform X2 [Latimeria chalumnae]
MKGENVTFSCLAHFRYSSYVLNFTRGSLFEGRSVWYQKIKHNAVVDSYSHQNRFHVSRAEVGVTVTMERVSLEDSGVYFLTMKRDSRFSFLPLLSNRLCTLYLIMKAPAEILNLTIRSENNLSSAVCTAEGEPLPQITWISPDGTELNATTSSSTRSEAFQTTQVLQNVTEGQEYWCVATNEYGSDEAALWSPSIILGSRDPGVKNSWFFLLILCVAPVVKVLGLLLLWKFFCCKPHGTSAARGSGDRQRLKL